VDPDGIYDPTADERPAAAGAEGDHEEFELNLLRHGRPRRYRRKPTRRVAIQLAGRLCCAAEGGSRKSRTCGPAGAVDVFSKMKRTGSVRQVLLWVPASGDGGADDPPGSGCGRTMGSGSLTAALEYWAIPFMVGLCVRQEPRQNRVIEGRARKNHGPQETSFGSGRS